MKLLEKFIRESIDNDGITFEELKTLYKNTSEWIDIARQLVIYNACRELAPDAKIPRWMDVNGNAKGPVNILSKDGYNMFETYGVSFPEWFNEHCDICMKRIRRFRRCVRLPLPNGTWEHTLCSHECVRSASIAQFGYPDRGDIVIRMLFDEGVPDL